MRILYLDLDTLRPDHLSCYGYHRQTSPNLDRIAAEGVRFDNCYVSDAPCLPSRAALFNGRFGIHTGVVNHGGTSADLRLEGAPRGFGNSRAFWPWVMALCNGCKLHTVSVSPFAERHGAWWFYNGFREMHNTGKRGGERADEVAPLAIDWIRRNARRDNWFLQVNFWDPHTPYRTPMEFGEPFADSPAPDWLTEEMIARHRASFGPHSAHEVSEYAPNRNPLPREVTEITSRADFRRQINGYDTGIRYMDEHVGQILHELSLQGVLDDLVIIVSSDHGENQGELNIYGDHQTADQITSRVPLLIRWPGVTAPRVDRALHYQLDLAPTVVDLLGGEIPAGWDGQSFAASLRSGQEHGRDHLVVSQCAWSCQRSVRFGDWLLMRTYHDGLKDFPPVMLYNIAEDPHETRDLAATHPQVADQGLALLERWTAEMMASSPSDADPLWTVIREGGPLHARGHLKAYVQRLRETGRAEQADKLLRRHPGEG